MNRIILDCSDWLYGNSMDETSLVSTSIMNTEKKTLDIFVLESSLAKFHYDQKFIDKYINKIPIYKEVKDYDINGITVNSKILNDKLFKDEINSIFSSLDSKSNSLYITEMESFITFKSFILGYCNEEKLFLLDNGLINLFSNMKIFECNTINNMYNFDNSEIEEDHPIMRPMLYAKTIEVLLGDTLLK